MKRISNVAKVIGVVVTATLMLGANSCDVASEVATPAPSPTPVATAAPPAAAAPAPAAPQQEAAAQSNCTPGYSPCLPPMSDYDCQGGSGNGPGYAGQVSVTGADPYGLDRDGDGVGCE